MKGRKKKIRQGLCLREETQRKRFRDKHPQWGTSGASHTLSAPVLAFETGKMVGWRTGTTQVS